MIITTDFIGINKVYRQVSEEFKANKIPVMPFKDFLTKINIPVIEVKEIKEEDENDRTKES